MVMVVQEKGDAKINNGQFFNICGWASLKRGEKC